MEEKDKEVLVDKAPVISPTTTPILEDTAIRISVEKLEKSKKVSCQNYFDVFHMKMTNKLIKKYGYGAC